MMSKFVFHFLRAKIRCFDPQGQKQKIGKRHLEDYKTVPTNSIEFPMLHGENALNALNVENQFSILITISNLENPYLLNLKGTAWGLTYIDIPSHQGLFAF